MGIHIPSFFLRIETLPQRVEVLTSFIASLAFFNKACPLLHPTKPRKGIKSLKFVNMKTRKGFLNVVVASAMLLTCAGALTSCDKDDDDNTQRSYNVTGNGNGSQVVPSVSGTSTGTFTGTYNPNTMMFSYTSNYNGLTGAPTSGGFYSGASGTTGTAMGTPWTFAAGSTGTGSYTGSMTLTQAQADQLLAGNWYYSYGTTAHTGGEVRGQLTAVQQ
jgi:hypothetical protein